MARTKQLARISTGPSRKQIALAKRRMRWKKIRTPTPSPPSSPEPINLVWEWMYIMVTLRDVANVLLDAFQTPESVVYVLGENENVYEMFNLDNQSETQPHIIVGRQHKSDGTYDMYIMFGITVDDNTDTPETADIQLALTNLLVRQGAELDVEDDDVFVMRQANNEDDVVKWNIHIIHLMDESIEVGHRQ